MQSDIVRAELMLMADLDIDPAKSKTMSISCSTRACGNASSV